MKVWELGPMHEEPHLIMMRLQQQRMPLLLNHQSPLLFRAAQLKKLQAIQQILSGNFRIHQETKNGLMKGR